MTAPPPNPKPPVVKPPSQYRTLISDRIVATAETLERRIAERFPEAGLRRVGADLLAVAKEAVERSQRIRRPNYGTLEIEITIDDPKVYTRPFTVRMDQTIEPDTDLIDEICLENEKSYQRLQAVRKKN